MNYHQKLNTCSVVSSSSMHQYAGNCKQCYKSFQICSAVFKWLSSFLRILTARKQGTLEMLKPLFVYPGNYSVPGRASRDTEYRLTFSKPAFPECLLVYFLVGQYAWTPNLGSLYSSRPFLSYTGWIQTFLALLEYMTRLFVFCVSKILFSFVKMPRKLFE